MNKYLIANIKIPIRLNPDGTSTSLINHSIIDIEPCDQLPPENGNQLLMIQESVKNYIQSQIQRDEMKPVIKADKEDSRNKEGILEKDKDAPSPSSNKGKNTTFRNYKKANAHRFTSKRYLS